MERFPHPHEKYRNRVPSFKGLGKCMNLSSKRNSDWSHTTLCKKFLEIGSASTQRATYCGSERRTIDTMGIDFVRIVQSPSATDFWRFCRFRNLGIRTQWFQ